MLKALLGIGIGAVITVTALVLLIFTSFSHRGDVKLEQDILATKAAESRDIFGTDTRYGRDNADDDSPPGEDSTPPP